MADLPKNQIWETILQSVKLSLSVNDLVQLFNSCGARNRDDDDIFLAFDEAIEFIFIPGGHCGGIKVEIQSRFTVWSVAIHIQLMLHVHNHVTATGRIQIVMVPPCKWCSLLTITANVTALSILQLNDETPDTIYCIMHSDWETTNDTLI